MHKLICYFGSLNLPKYLLFQPHVSPVIEKLYYLAMLSLLNGIIGPSVDNLLKLLYLNDDLESFDLLLRLIVLFQTFKALMQSLIVISLPIKTFELGFHGIYPQGIDCLFQYLVDEEIPTYCFQLFLVFSSNCIVKQLKEYLFLYCFMGLFSDDTDLSLFFCHLPYLTLPKCEILDFESSLVSMRNYFLTILQSCIFLEPRIKAVFYMLRVSGSYKLIMFEFQLDFATTLTNKNPHEFL